MPVLKKNGKIMVCIDFSEFNLSIRRERFKIPVAERIFGRMQGVIVLQILMLNQDLADFLYIKAYRY